MLKQILLVSTLVGSVLACSVGARAADFGTREEAKAMLNRAIVALKVNKAAAINKFNYNDAQFRDRDLFVFCFNRSDGKFTAHESMVGWDVRALRDIWGTPYGEEMFAVKDGKTLEVTYLSAVPGSTMLSPRRAYVTGVGDQACGVSAFQLNGQVAQKQ